MAKKYVWLKLKDDFFQQRPIKKLRKIAGGDTYTIIYLKLQLLSLKDEGKLFYEGVEDDFMEEMALAIDEDVENVKVTLMFLEKNGLLETISEDEYVLPQVVDCIGSETAAAERMRKMRNTKSQEKIEVKDKKRNIVTPMLPPVTNDLQEVTEQLPSVTNCYTEKEEEKDKEIDKDTTTKKDIVNNIDPENYETEKSSSSFFELVKNILDKSNISDRTKANILALSKDTDLRPERVSKVLEVAKKKNWQEGAIYTALRDNWSIDDSKNQTLEEQERERQRAKSAQIDEQMKKDSQKFQEQKDKVLAEQKEKEDLLQYLKTLDADTQKRIRDFALEKAKKQFPAVYEIMANSKVLFEVIREYRTRKL